MYLRATREFTAFLSRSPDAATPDDLRAFQLDMSEKGTGAATLNNRLALCDLADEIGRIGEKILAWNRAGEASRRLATIRL